MRSVVGGKAFAGVRSPRGWLLLRQTGAKDDYADATVHVAQLDEIPTTICREVTALCLRSSSTFFFYVPRFDVCFSSFEVVV